MSMRSHWHSHDVSAYQGQRATWMRSAAFALAISLLAAGAGLAQHGGARHAQPYAGQDSRSVASLSEEEVQAFLDGRGMGLAKSAELNGYPGPQHVLDMADDLKLTDAQRRQVRQAFERMKARATELGKRYVQAEKAVDDAFKAPAADAAVVAARVAEANRLLGEVRLAHLAAHLEITPLLTAEQRMRYAELRGYGGDGGHQHRHKH